jgi:predicted DNA-binding transcriptional regulator YafY
MNIHLTLDYQTILRNEPRPVHLVAKLTAQKLEPHARSRSAAFAVVIDRSGSMSGKPLQLARESCAAVVRNLRPKDFFSLVVFDDSAQVVIPLQKPTDRQGMMAAIAGISEGGSTNLMAGWLLGRDELLKVGSECDKKILILTDGHLNRGITEPDTVEALTRSGFGKEGIRTSCLGFGDSYNEEILLAMSGVGHGQLHDADSADKFPAILAHELDGLQRITAQNVRLHFDAYLPDAKIFTDLTKAIQNEKVVEFDYKKLDAKAYEKRTVEPWHLACVSGQWYLLGYDQTRAARRIFVLARMRDVCSAKRQFSALRPGDADIQKLFQNSFQIWQTEDAKLQQIVLRFSGRAAQLVRERNWHPSQRIQELADGTLELRMTLNALEEIVPWILSWGKECRVLSPPKLQRKVESLAMKSKRERRGTRGSDSSADDQYLL